METYHNDVIKCYIWDLQETSQRRTDGTSKIRTTETSWWLTTEMSLGVSFDTCLAVEETYWWDVVVTSSWELSRRSNKVSWRRTTETSWRRSTVTSLGVSSETYLRRHWDVQRDVAATSPRRLNAEWIHTFLYTTLFLFLKTQNKFESMFLHHAVELKIAFLFIKGEFSYIKQVRIWWRQFDGANFDVLIQRKHRKTKKTNFLKETIENADLHKSVLNKTMTIHKYCV